MDPTDPRLVLIVAALLLAPILPTGAAGASDAGTSECAGAPCEMIALYVLQNGAQLSTLVGDGGPDAGSVGEIDAQSLRVKSDVVVAKRDAFHVELVSQTSPDDVEGTVSVYGVSVTGSEFMLAQRTFAAELSLPDANAFAVDAVWAQAAPFDEQIGAAYAELRAGPGAASSVLEQATCSNLGPFCPLVGPTPSFGPYETCTPQPPSTIFPRLVWEAANAADGSARDATGVGICGHDPWGAGGPYATQADGTIDNNTGSLPPYPDLRDLVPVEPGNASAPAWRSFSMDAMPPEWLEQDEDSFVLPSGIALRFAVELGNIMNPIIFKYGSPEAPTRLEIRTGTPIVFSELAANTEPISEGLHTGSFANLYDVDDYSIDVSAAPGAAVNVTRLPGPFIRFDLWSPTGRLTSGSENLRVAVTEPGAWTLRVSNGDGPQVSDVTSDEYAFDLRIERSSTEQDDGRTVGEGTYEGALGPEDETDTYTIPIWKAQRFTVRVDHDAADNYDLSIASPSSFWAIEETSAPDHATYTARAEATGTVTLIVSRAWGSGPYALAVDLDEGGDLTAVPQLQTIYSPSKLGTDLRGHNGMAYVSNGSTLVAVGPDGTAQAIRAMGVFGTVAFTAAGDLIVYDNASGEPAISIVREEGTDALVRSGTRFAFGTDGLYSYRADGAGREIVRIDQDRRETSWPTSVNVGDILATATGGLFLVNNSGRAFAFDSATGTTTRAPSYDGVKAFDAAGRGYRVLGRTLIERFDPASGTARIVAQVPTGGDIHSVATTGAHLYALRAPLSGWNPVLAVVPLDGVGFGGIEPAFAPPGAPDLTPIAAEDAATGIALDPTQTYVIGETHTLRVTVKNEGASPARSTILHMSTRLTYATATILPLAPGEAAVVTIDWLATHTIGDAKIRIKVDAGSWDLAESDETNNRAELWTPVFVTGDHAACLALHEVAAPGDEPLLCEQDLP